MEQSPLSNYATRGCHAPFHQAKSDRPGAEILAEERNDASCWYM
jgi:hypothetical protein